MADKYYIVALNDPIGGDDRVVYITNWGISPWLQYAKEFKTKVIAKIAAANCISGEYKGLTLNEMIEKQ